jgi:hexosaminidase
MIRTALIFSFTMIVFFAQAQELSLMPVPQQVTVNGQKFRVRKDFSISISGNANDRLYREASRFRKRLAERAVLNMPAWTVDRRNDGSMASLVIKSDHPGTVQLEMEESYSLDVKGDGIRIEAASDIGAIRGLETLFQLLYSDKDGFYFQGVSVKDKPRFAWRGLLLSQPYHFMPLDVIKRMLDAMALVKLNVLHYYISDDQAWTIESKVYPKLHQQASHGEYLTQDQVREMIGYADQRGIRVVPEVDLPGHSTAFLTAFPELASIPRKYQLQDHWGVFDPSVDPTKTRTYEVLDTLLTEVASLFKDNYFHIGGDENNGKDWARSDSIQRFMAKEGLPTTVALQNHFNKKVRDILRRSNKTVVGWDEVLMKVMNSDSARNAFESGRYDQLIHPSVPKDMVIQSWRGMEALLASAKNGYRSILSKGYYIDLVQPTSYHYLNDPYPEMNSEIIPDSEADLNRFESDITRKVKEGKRLLTPEEESLIIGGEATMWTEHVTAETLDSRVWPRTAAIAERLWSPSSVRDVPDMYRRMDRITIQLEWVGSLHIRNRTMMLRRISGQEATGPLEKVVNLIEPVKGYRRNNKGDLTKFSPYTEVVDIAIPDPRELREFNGLIDSVLLPNRSKKLNDLEREAKLWRSNHAQVLSLSASNPNLDPIVHHSASLSDLSSYVEDYVRMRRSSKKPDVAWKAKFKMELDKASAEYAHCDLGVISALRKLLN